MASGFIILEDGRCWARRWTFFNAILLYICEGLPEDSFEFKTFLKTFVPNEDDIEMGWGFIRITDDKTIERYIDLRELSPQNRTTFWKAAQNVSTKLSHNKDLRENFVFALRLLLKMHKKVNRRESPVLLNDFRDITLATGIRKGPGW